LRNLIVAFAMRRATAVDLTNVEMLARRRSKREFIVNVTADKYPLPTDVSKDHPPPPTDADTISKRSWEIMFAGWREQRKAMSLELFEELDAMCFRDANDAQVGMANSDVAQ
jgi:hypothetical protein